MPYDSRHKRAIKCKFCCGCCTPGVCGLCCRFWGFLQQQQPLNMLFVLKQIKHFELYSWLYTRFGHAVVNVCSVMYHPHVVISICKYCNDCYNKLQCYEYIVCGLVVSSIHSLLLLLQYSQLYNSDSMIASLWKHWHKPAVLVCLVHIKWFFNFIAILI